MKDEKCAEPKYESGNSQLLKDYRDALVKAFKLGEEIKYVYGIVPPRALLKETVCREHEHRGRTEFSGRVGLEVAGDFRN